MYVNVEDVDAATEKAKELGARVMIGKTHVEGMGVFSIVVDPQGAAVALWEETPHQG